MKNRVPRKIDFRADGTHESHPTAWELKAFIFNIEWRILPRKVKRVFEHERFALVKLVPKSGNSPSFEFSLAKKRQIN